jgi:hypothetical protein
MGTTVCNSLDVGDEIFRLFEVNPLLSAELQAQFFLLIASIDSYDAKTTDACVLDSYMTDTRSVQ